MAARLDHLPPDDRDGIVEVGAALEELAAQLPAAAAGLQEHASVALQALQALFTGSPEGAATVGVARDAVLALAGGLVAEASSAAAATLDSVAALLVQAEAGDAAGMAELAQALRAAASASAPEGLAGALELAADQVQGIAQGECRDPASVLRGVERLLTVASGGEPGAGRPAHLCGGGAEGEAEGAPPEWSGDLPAEVDRDLLAEFIAEARENIVSAEAGLLALETQSEDAGAVDTVFRAFHTLKGTSAFLGLTAISELSHRAESLLSRARDGDIRLSGGYADLALRSADMLEDLTQALQDGLGGEPMRCPAGFDELMRDLADPEAAAVTADDAQASAVAAGDTPLRAGRPGGPGAARGERPAGRTGSAGGAPDSSVRVRTDRLDKLIETVGELVIAHSMLAQDATVRDQLRHELAKKVARTGKIVRELQDLTMSMRMVPLKATFQKMARLARDVARRGGKEAVFSTEGEDTEIDRNMVDLVSDPLVHMVRNAISHGLEPPWEREAAGKPRAGRVVLSACHAGGNVVLELSDDGRGLHRDMIVARALSRGVIETDKGLSDGDVCNLIFLPGFSTADEVTEVSGRGVGLDVVKRNVEALRGRIEISSEPGAGTRFMIRLPLTLAVTDGMLVRVGPERYIIPTLSIDLTFQPGPQNLFTVAERGELVLVREQLMPMVRLDALFGVSGAAQDPVAGLLVVLADGDRRYAVLVDELLGQQQVVAKSLGDGLGRVPGVSGAAILGDGRVGLILDPGGLSCLARHSVPQTA